MSTPDYNQFTYEWLLQEALSNVPDTVDKRPGSIIYDALAPAMYELALYFMELQNLLTQTFVSTATGDTLDLRAGEQGLSRHKATFAVKRGRFKNEADAPMTINVGSRFSATDGDIILNYVVTDMYRDELGNVVAGDYLLTCETVGTIGNDYSGQLIPITYIRNLAKAELLEVIVSGSDEETDDALRERYFQKVNDRPFGGNIAQYDEVLRAIDGVGEVQIYPTWDGGGTVKLSVVDSSFEPILPTFINQLSNMIDPENAEGKKGDGLGLAPIGHNVTIVTPSVQLINISAKLVLQGGTTIDQVRQPILDKLEAYLFDLREKWGVADQYNNYLVGVYVARVNAEILSVLGVVNISTVTINGQANDLILQQDATKQTLPMLGSVTLSE